MNNKQAPSLFLSVMANKCPRCREGKLFKVPNPYNFKTTMQMPEKCPVCGQDFNLHTGFYFGTGYVSYAITALFSVLSFAIWWFTVGMSFSNNHIWWWLGINSGLLIALQPIIQRTARSIWIAFFVKYDREGRG